MPSETEAAAEASADAALAEAEERDWGTSPEDIEAYAEVAGAVAGAAACSAVGAAAAAPLCAIVAGAITGWIAGTVAGWFTDSEEAEAAIQRRADVRAHFATAEVAEALNQENARSFNDYLDRLIALHSELWPGDPWIGPDPAHFQAQWQPAMLLLQLHGAPMEAREGIEVSLGIESVVEYWWELQNLGIGTDRKVALLTERAQEIFLALERAYNRSVLQMTTRTGAARGIAETERSEAARGRISDRIARTHGYGIYATPDADPTVQPARDWAHTPAIDTPEAQAHYTGRRSPYIEPARQSWPKAAAAIGGVALVGAGLAYFKPFAGVR